MRSREAVVHCDHMDGECGEWSFDYYEQTASTVGGVRITRAERAPGWRSTNLEDFCPRHANPFVHIADWNERETRPVCGVHEYGPDDTPCGPEGRYADAHLAALEVDA